APDIPPGLSLAAYRILQEALANVRGHAGAVWAAALVIGAEPVPEVELETLLRELRAALAREVGQDRLHRLLLGHAAVERLLAAEAGRDLQRLAPVLAQRREDVDQEVAVRDRLADLEPGVPRRPH